MKKEDIVSACVIGHAGVSHGLRTAQPASGDEGARKETDRVSGIPDERCTKRVRGE